MELKLDIQYIEIWKIKSYENNPKLHSEEQINLIISNIKKFWYCVPIIVDKNNQIIAWHWRIEAIKRLWGKKVPCVFKSDLTPEQAVEFRISENKTHESSYDQNKLKEELTKIKWYWVDLTELWFDEMELASMNLTVIDTGNIEDIWDTGNIWDIQPSGNETQKTPPIAKQWETFDPNLLGEQNRKQMITFFADKEEFELLNAFYWTARSQEFDIKRLVEITKFYQEKNKDV